MRAEVWNKCCRDLRTYLETALAGARGGAVSVKMKRLLKAEMPWPDRMRYSHCLSHILRQWRWSVGVYVVPRRDAELLLADLDELCASVKHSQRLAKNAQRVDTPRVDAPANAPPAASVLVSFHVPRALMQALDEYAQRRNTTRSAVVRSAIAQLIEKYRNVEIDMQRPAALAASVASEDELVLVTFHETPYVAELLDMYATASQVSRSDVVRAAIRQLLDKIRAEETREESECAVVI
jgi:metal-responsive CopG/Arc/MetJ family transcriptional regulator